MSLEGMALFVCVDSDEDEYLLIAEDEAVEAYYEENPDADRFAVANAVGRELTDEERKWLPVIYGALVY